MKIAYFDCFSGISGDMAAGALLDAGVPLRVVEEGLAMLGIDSSQVRLSTRTIVRSEIHATKFDVTGPDGEPADAVAHVHHHEHGEHHHHEHGDHQHHHAHDHGHHHHGHDHPHDHGQHGHGEHGHGEDAHGHGHPHDHVHGHEHDHHHNAHDPHDHVHDHGHEHHHHDHDHPHEHGHHHEHRGYADIVAMIERSALPERARNHAKDIFRAIAIGEGRIHNVAVEDVHFHEVGGLDSIADIVAVAVCLDHLGIDAIYSAPVPLGSGGMIRTQHGVMPLPAPATLEILKGYPVRLTDIPFELTTPTGAGIIKALSRGTLAMERLMVERIGFGAGTRELPDRPNLLRVVIGEITSDEEHDVVTVVEANIDDMNPQVYPYLIERLLESGALDAYLTPVTMKKGRPGMLLTAVAPDGALDELVKVIYRETTTIGVRFREMTRRKLPRESILVPTEWGDVRMKRIVTPDGTRIVPEFEEARRIAREHSLPLRDVMEKMGRIGG